MEQSQKLVDKKVEDFTVGDALKINGVVLGVSVGLMAAGWVGVVVSEKVSDWRFKRKAKKANNVIDV